MVEIVNQLFQYGLQEMGILEIQTTENSTVTWDGIYQSKNEKKLIKNKSDFKTHVTERITVSGGIRHPPLGVVWGGIGPGAPRVCRA